MAEKSRSEYAFLNMLSGLSGYVLNMLLGIVCRMVFTRVFTADYLGITGLFNNVIGMLSLAELGIGSAIVYALYEPLAKNDTAKIATLVKFYGKCYRVIGLVVFAVGLALMPFMDLIITEKPDIAENYNVIYLILLFNTASTYFFSYRSSLLVAAQKNYIITFFSNIMVVVQNIVQIVIILSFKSYIGYLLVSATGIFITNVYSYIVAQKQYPFIKKLKSAAPLSKEEKSGLVRNVRALTMNRIGGILVNSTDNIIITYFSNLASVGLLSNYTLLSTSVSSVLNIVFTSLNASVGNHNVSETKDKKLSMFNTINLANFWLYGWSSIGFVVLANDVVKLMFGEGYLLPVSIPLVVATNYYIVGMQNAVWTYSNTHGLFHQVRYVPIITASINLVASFALGRLWGLFGILLATVISRLLTSVWHSPYIVFKYVFGIHFKAYMKKYIWYAVVLVATGAICWFVCSFINVSPIVNVIVKFIICCIIPNAIFLVLFRKREEFATLFGFVQGILGGIKNKIKR